MYVGRVRRFKFSMWAWFSTEDFHHISGFAGVVAYWLIDGISCYLDSFIQCDAKRGAITVGASPWAINRGKLLVYSCYDIFIGVDVAVDYSL